MRIAHDFRDVKERLPAHKHIPDPLPEKCNVLYPSQHSVKLPPCHPEEVHETHEPEAYPVEEEHYPEEVHETHEPEYPGYGYGDRDCIDSPNCHRPCHKRFLSLGGDCKK